MHQTWLMILCLFISSLYCRGDLSFYLPGEFSYNMDISTPAEVTGFEIGGSTFKAGLDLSHPPGYGFERNLIPVFKRSQLFIRQNPNPYDTPLLFPDNSLLCGYISKQNYKLLNNSAAINVYGPGKRRIISFTDNPNFRAVWYGTNRLFMIARMFG